MAKGSSSAALCPELRRRWWGHLMVVAEGWQLITSHTEIVLFWVFNKYTYRYAEGNESVRQSSCLHRKWLTLKLLTLMDWFYVFPKGYFLSCFVFTLLALKPSWADFMCVWRSVFHFALNHCGHWNLWPTWTDFMCVWMLRFCVALYSHCGHWNLWPSWTDLICLWSCVFCVAL